MPQSLTVNVKTSTGEAVHPTTLSGSNLAEINVLLCTMSNFTDSQGWLRQYC